MRQARITLTGHWTLDAVLFVLGLWCLIANAPRLAVYYKAPPAVKPSAQIK